MEILQGISAGEQGKQDRQRRKPSKEELMDKSKAESGFKVT